MHSPDAAIPHIERKAPDPRHWPDAMVRNSVGHWLAFRFSGHKCHARGNYGGTIAALLLYAFPSTWKAILCTRQKS